jgi:molybdate transport system substrate-binding protein
MPSRANAAELKLLAGSSMRTLLPDLLAQFEKSSGYKVVPEYGTLGANADHVMKGEGDVAIVTAAQNEKLEKEGKLLAGSQAELAEVGYGILIKATAPKPNISTVDAFKHTLLEAKSIGEGDPSGGGPVGVYTAGLLQRLGLADELKPKTKLYPSGTQVAEAVAKGEREFGIGLASDAVVVPGLTAVPLPAEIQRYTKYTLGVVSNSRSPDAAKALVAFLTSSTTKQALAAHGFEVQ